MAEKLGAQTLVTKAAPVTPTLAVPRFEGLERLAQALTTFGERLPQFAVERSQKQAEEEFEKGSQAAALAISQGIDTFQELEDAGILSKGSNPFFRDAVLEMAGKARADQFGASIQVAYAERFGNNPSFDEDDFDDFAESFSASFEEDHPGMVDPAVTDGFAGRAADYLNSLRQKHAGTVADNIIELGDESLGILFRGKILDRKVNGDPLTQVADTIVALDEVRNDWAEAQGGIDRMSRFDKTRMNNKLVATIVNAVDVGDLTDAQAKKILETMLSGKGSPLINVPRHALALTKAANRRASFVLTQDSLSETAAVRAQQNLADEARVMLLATLDSETGDIDTGPLLALFEANPTAYPDNFVAQVNGFRDDVQSMVNAPYSSNAEFKGQVLADILQRRYANPKSMREFIVGSIGRGKGASRLNPVDALSLTKELDRMIAMDAEGGSRMSLFNELQLRVKGAVGGFLPDAIGQSNANQAAPVATELFKAFFAANPNALITDVKSQQFITDVTNKMRDQFVTPEVNDLIKDQLRRVEVSNETAHFETTTFITDIPTLTRWLAEVEVEAGDEGNGSFLSEDLNLFLQAPGRSVSEEAQSQVDVIMAAVEGQLRRNGIKVSDRKFRKEVDAIKATLLRDSQVAADSAAGRIRLGSGLGVAAVQARVSQQLRERAQATRNRLARATAAPLEQNPNIPISSSTGSPVRGAGGGG